MPHIQADLVTRLVNLRQQLNLSQRELAAEFGVTPGALAMWERGQRPIPGIAIKIIEIYEETINEEVALRRQQDIIRRLSKDWGSRLMLTFGKGSKGKKKNEIEEKVNNSLGVILKHELSSNQIKRNIQIALIERLITAASQTKGLPMKFMQMMSYLQPDMHPTARSALEEIFSLQYPMAPTIVAKVIAENLGAPPQKLFKEWSATPIATASIGQVHLARLKTGEQVVVKVQYPDIRNSVQKDLRTFGFIGQIGTFLNPALQEILAGIKETIIKETDYQNETMFLQEFRNICKDDPKIIIPKVFPKYCTKNVITMEYIDGMTLKEFKRESIEERRAAAETIARFVTKTTFQNSVMNTDAHAGNFIFCGNGKVAFLDFGRCVRLKKDQLQEKELLKAVIQRDREWATSVIPKLHFIKNPETFDFDRFWSFFMGQQLHLHSGKFHFTYDYIKKTMDATKNFDGKSDLEITLEFIWSSTISFGTWTIFAELDVDVDYGNISLQVLNQSS